MKLQEAYDRDLFKHYQPNTPVFTVVVWTLNGEVFDSQEEVEKTKDDKAIALFLEGTLIDIKELIMDLGFSLRVFPCRLSNEAAKAFRDSFRIH